jgi:hypothetical protein
VVVDKDAEQLAVVPPLEPAHDQVHGPEPATLDAVPAVQRLVEGALATVVPFAVPQVPLVNTGAEQEVVVPPLLPAHDHVQGPVPATLDAVPAVQRLVAGAAVTPTLFALPHAPFVAVTNDDCASGVPAT